MQSDATSIHIGNVAGDRFIQITPIDVFPSLPAMTTSKNISICPLACLSSLAIFEIFLPHCEALCLRPDRCMFECSQVRLVDMSSKRLQTVRCQRRSSLFEQFTKHIAVVVTSGQEGDCPRRYGRSCPRGAPLTAFAFCVFGCTSSLEKKKTISHAPLFIFVIGSTLSTAYVCTADRDLILLELRSEAVHVIATRTFEEVK